LQRLSSVSVPGAVQHMQVAPRHCHFYRKGRVGNNDNLWARVGGLGRGCPVAVRFAVRCAEHDGRSEGLWDLVSEICRCSASRVGRTACHLAITARRQSRSERACSCSAGAGASTEYIYGVDDRLGGCWRLLAAPAAGCWLRWRSETCAGDYQLGRPKHYEYRRQVINVVRE
jgi:hypothetical protein